MENSQCSTASTIPYEITINCDEEFIQDLEIVDNLYFSNNEILHLNSSSENSDSCDSDENNEDGYTSASEGNVSMDRESLKQETFFKDSCGCKKQDNSPCTTVIDRDILVNYRLSMLEKSSQELDLIIKSQLFQHRTTNQQTCHGKERQRPRQLYYFAGKSVCKMLFSFAHGVHRKTVDAIGRSLDTNGLEERVHGNAKKAPKHALTVEDVKNVKNFLIHYATQNGVPLPGRTSHFRDIKAILLPSDKNKADIFCLYCEAADIVGSRRISVRSFYRLWNEHCPNILVMKPTTDLCTTCQKHAQQIVNSGNSTEEEKEDQLAQYQRHLEKVQCQRNHYRKDLENECLSAENKIRGQVPCSLDVPVVYSFDYAQQVLYPHYSQQVGPMYFRTPRKCQCFGVCCESAGTQIFYLLDEGQGAGKGSNSVTSMLHHHFQVHGFGEQHVKLNMDNCSGQNKNNTVLGYFLWRSMTGAHKTIEISLMEAGHTKFGPDWHFGLWKVRWRHSQAETMNDIQETVRVSSRSGHNIPQLIDDPHNPVKFYDWKSF